tara:strand:+ start:1022 stop:1222 length:201 start_codon:yes stop_codon:yes gene_type:complete
MSGSGPVADPAKLTLQYLSGTVATIHTTVQTWLRANLAVNDFLFGIDYIPNKYNDKITAIVMFGDQ